MCIRDRFRYITFRTGGAVITGLLFVFLFGQNIIKCVQRCGLVVEDLSLIHI